MIYLSFTDRLGYSQPLSYISSLLWYTRSLDLGYIKTQENLGWLIGKKKKKISIIMEIILNNKTVKNINKVGKILFSIRNRPRF